ncbi:MAG: M20/M25/M40 family metallo-hydrolase [Peptococcaceae bacterium]
MHNNKLIIVWGTFLLITSIALGLFLGYQPQKKLPGNVAENREQPEAAIDKQKIKAYVKKLCSTEFKGRRSGTKEDGELALYLSRELQEMGVSPAGIKNTYFQTFPLPLTDLRWEGKRLTFYIKDENSNLVADNILGVIESPLNPDKYILLSAHYDHLGVYENRQYPGANDNGSGVASVLEIARVLQEQKERLPYSVIIAFWGAEEMGLIGSNYFVGNPTIDLTKIKFNINLDSIGSGARNDFIIWNSGPQEVLRQIYSQWSQWENSNFTREETNLHSSDHKSLAKANIPSLTILAADWLTGNHTSADNYITLNYDKITFLAQNVAGYLSSEKIIPLLQ